MVIQLVWILITLTRRVRHVKHPDLVRRCLTVSDPGALFLLTLDGFEFGVIFPPSGTTKKVVRGGWSNRGTKFPLGTFGCAGGADDVGRWFTSSVEFDDRYNPVMTVGKGSPRGPWRTPCLLPAFLPAFLPSCLPFPSWYSLLHHRKSQRSIMRKKEGKGVKR